ncbi:MAG: HAMP domain-containing histidine kinase [Salinivirgaceae bacterium]|nr:HAMP domain-containing histidine kinase [Salinivirgaceae bacterium]
MKSTLHRILVALIIIVFLPLASITFYEYLKLDDQEKLISDVYKSQLESMVSSLNSYSQDVANNWAQRFESSLKYEKDTNGVVLKRLMDENPSITAIFMAPLNGRSQKIHQSQNSSLNDDFFENLMQSQAKNLTQLVNYFKNNYRKFLTYAVDDKTSIIYFIAEDAGGDMFACFFEVENYPFLEDNLSSKMQSIAQEDFVITLMDSVTTEVLVSTEKQLDKSLDYDLEGALWLMPQVKIKISLKSETISDLVKGRVTEGLILFAMILLVLLVGIWFLYASIKREIQLTQIKSEFIANVSHEIRTPLALISMYIETLEMGRVTATDKVHEYYQIISKETQRLTGMVNKILNFSKMENGKRQFKFAPCDLNSITQKVLETYDFHFVNKGFEHHFLPAENLPQNHCDPDAVADALINLIDNAVKYSPDKKYIEIRTGTEKNFTYVEVKDFGQGISKKHHKLVFDKFYRVTNENLANKVKGTGLGLAIVSEIVKGHKGKVTLTSKLNEGSTFRLYFPTDFKSS